MVTYINAVQKDVRCCPASRTGLRFFNMNKKSTIFTVAESNLTVRIPTAKDSRHMITLTSIFVECI